MEGVAVALNCKACIFTWLWLNLTTIPTATLLYRKVLLSFMEVLQGTFFHEFKDSLMQTFRILFLLGLRGSSASNFSRKAGWCLLVCAGLDVRVWAWSLTLRPSRGSLNLGGMDGLGIRLAKEEGNNHGHYASVWAPFISQAAFSCLCFSCLQLTVNVKYFEISVLMLL